MRGRAFRLVVFCAAFLAVSCGGDDDPGETIAEVTTTTVGSTTTQAETSAADGSSTTTVVETTTTAAPALDGAESPEAALRQLIDARGLGQHGRAWDLVLPSQRALLSRDAFFTCSEDGPSVDVISVEVIDSYPERITAAGVGEQDSQAMTLKITLSTGAGQITDTDTYHALTENGRWYVTLTDDAFACAEA